MGSSGYGLNAPPSPPQPAIADLAAQKLHAEAVVKTGAGWFLTIAILSMINSILSMTGTGIRFIFGLGVARIVDAIAEQLGHTGYALDLVINGFVAGVFVLFWYFARKAQPWAFWVGMILYALDGIISLLIQNYIGAAFHAYALYRIYMGTTGIPAVREVERQMGLTGAPITPQ